MAVEPFPARPDDPGPGEPRPVTRIRTDDLVRTLVVARPLDDVVQLVTLLEQSPDGLPTAATVLRVAAVARSVEDVSRLVELLGPPEHSVDRMDEAIRTAAEQRPVAEVGRLVALLHAAPHAAHAEAQAVHAAATSRPVEDLVQLIGRIGDAQDEAAAPAPAPHAEPYTAPRAEEPAVVAGARRGDVLWLRRAVAVLVMLCGAAHFPLDWVDAPRYGLTASLGVSALCLLAGAALWFSRSTVVTGVAVVVSGALAAAHLLGTHLDSATLAYVRQAGGAASPLPALAACVATLAALTALAVSLARRWRATGARDAAPDPVLKVNSLRL
ncbi:hypothetical protein STRTUCAR8_08714 [Streptomyces turgidiscabies Car8]|uniref:Uncharacterized protein n=1 Tax=Streptomyces turgidiscabies (strain Car8) TaxID=698760 RepID=L7FI46_STRT8|nr:hypothetical protein STRTUCAR8_08714 [Streptomyces turgidiscabies Car8]GAQ72931.1 hypothetical protein T45_04687 [Streptomyces turgidiscabies]